MVRKYQTTARRQVEINKRYGRLLVKTFAGRNKSGNLQWNCICSCGVRKVVTTSNLLGSTCPSCGCYKSEITTKRNKENPQWGGSKGGLKHGFHGTPEYSAWLGMFARCYRKTCRHYPSYGGRGLVVCQRWFKIENFMADMGKRPGPGYSIERVNNDIGYNPENYIWATPAIQNRNRRNVKLYLHDGKQKTIPDLAREFKFEIGTLEKRIKSYGWSVDRAISTPLRHVGK